MHNAVLDHAEVARAFAKAHPVTTEEKVVPCSFGCIQRAIAQVKVSGGNLIFNPGAVVNLCYDHIVRTASADEITTLIIYEPYEFGQYLGWQDRQITRPPAEIPSGLLEVYRKFFRE